MEKIIPSFIIISIFVNLIWFFIRVFLWKEIPNNVLHLGLSLILTNQIYMLTSLLPLFLPFMLLVARSYGNAQIISLLEELQKSEIKFEDKEDIDEFDAGFFIN